MDAQVHDAFPDDWGAAPESHSPAALAPLLQRGERTEKEFEIE